MRSLPPTPGTTTYIFKINIKSNMLVQHGPHPATTPGPVHSDHPESPRPGPGHREGRPGRVEGRQSAWDLRYARPQQCERKRVRDAVPKWD